MNKYIAKCIDEKRKVKIFMVNGYQMDGVIVDCGEDYILLRCHDNDKIVMLHAVSTIAND